MIENKDLKMNQFNTLANEVVKAEITREESEFLSKRINMMREKIKYTNTEEEIAQYFIELRRISEEIEILQAIHRKNEYSK
ncbi:hypothetical protein M3649_04225 [Ureibacillus chungkukjangi]|uniref:hypothetical protein n=1 Tax=Ureibacillus chungkukjangi TaxID=1202712 RepID=UPI00203D959A|nr:hypothetical protein [Ureibacillus chungkukjangi]MCM3387340.1 hypothetical protein [Ureibacillus chungkukjangi]